MPSCFMLRWVMRRRPSSASSCTFVSTAVETDKRRAGCPLKYALFAAEQDRHERVRKTLQPHLHVAERQTPWEWRIVAHGLIARAEHARGETQRGREEDERVLDLHARPEMRHLLYTDDRVLHRRLGRALSMVGEVQYRLAMKPYHLAMADRMPDASSKRPHSPGDATKWLKRRWLANRVAEMDFVRIRAIQPVPPPRWTAKAAARVAELWVDMHRQILNLKLTTDWQRSKAAKIVRRTHRALDSCLRATADHQAAAADAARCERMLAELRPNTFQLDTYLVPPLIPVAMRQPGAMLLR